MGHVEGNLQLVNAISGRSIGTHVQYFMTMEDLKRFVIQQWHIPGPEIFILQPYGGKFKRGHFQDMVSEAKKAVARGRVRETSVLYVFDRRLFDGGEEALAQATRHDSTTLVRPLVSPLEDAEAEVGERAAASLLTTNLGWLSALEIDVRYFHACIEGWVQQLANMKECLSVLLQYLELYSFDIEKLYHASAEAVDGVRQRCASNDWRQKNQELLETIDAVASRGKLVQFVDLEEMSEAEERLRELERLLSKKLSLFRGALDENHAIRQEIANHIKEVGTRYQDNISNYELEAQILGNFKDMVKKVKEDTRTILDLDTTKVSPDLMTSAVSLFKEMKSTAIPALYTVGLSLFTQASKCMETKASLQREMLVILADIAVAQVNIVDAKNSLLQQVNQDISALHTTEQQLLRVSELPVVYGLYLIELYRRQHWITGLDRYYSEHTKEIQSVLQRELVFREKWSSDFSSYSEIFQWQDDKPQLAKLFSNASPLEVGRPCIDIGTIQTYIEMLARCDVAEDSQTLLKKTLSEVSRFQFIVKSPLAGSVSKDSTDSMNEVIEGYKNRINKLELLLHSTQFSNTSSWPTGVLNSNSLNVFHNNIASINEKLLLSDYKSRDSIMSGKSNEKELQSQLVELQKQLEEAKNEAKRVQQQLKTTKTQLLNGEDERTAYKETLSILNAELSKLILNQEEQKQELVIAAKDFQEKLDVSMRQVNDLLKQVNFWKSKCGDLDKIKQDLLANMATKETDFNNRCTDYERNIVELQRQLSEKCDATNERSVTSTSADVPGETKEYIESLKEVNRRLEEDMFAVFAGNIVLLENIGLLLSRGPDNKLQIIRVKGLRKNIDDSIIKDSSPVINSHMVKSTVFQDVKNLFDELQLSQGVNDQLHFVSELERFYEEDLFQTSVIKRFTDVENLAKKLRKENKAKKSVIERHNKDKITFRDLKVGDLALFLPTRGVAGSLTSSVASSLASSFSSVDLSTPPPPLPTASQSLIKVTPHKPHRNKSTPWAVFTASELGVRYFLKDSEELVKGKDWFVGKIQSMEKYTVNGDSRNPFKLPEGMVWYEVVASCTKEL
ncbi:ADL307Wp [Eremothecium gossypii ATCC 10895]|uniref:Autophagy-related protein 11 n=1 Tax=Eremothecium gossypii (strain ATCC 10895 / CBS 109.51 / FGSC 9923 / NRRL Y-1056) TaxID=284811 RepID=ATG11_EREGS|nr:ADL307Wp [Eremothecium gossypii ATCC 10895]Q75B79.1 RecName: Full=Autophagy-related protein 11 [Eremothecium gossypii ATCC 10895]AAS51613.1 ADL307Wp [Eremothecium gossypii ATCC 10895]